MNDKNKDDPTFKNIDAKPYDACLSLDSEGKVTQNEVMWTFVYAFNAFMYIGLSVMSVLLCCGAWFWQARVCGFLGHCLGCLVHLGAVILATVARFNDAGEACSENKV